MHWKLKALVQNLLSRLPEGASYASYYRLQRMLGALRRIDPSSRLRAGVDTWRQLQRQGAEPVDKVFLEVGTGRMLNVPTAFWLMGARRTVTVDLNPYLKQELVLDALRHIAENQESTRELFGELLDEQRFESLIAYASDSRASLAGYLDLIQADYRAPGDAADTGLPDSSIDFHTSFTVLEHIPPDVLTGILSEARRLLRPDGLAVHCVDYSDHFCHSDPSISSVNFLRFTPEEWDRWAGNRYMYMNRLRHPQYLRLVDKAGLRLADCQTRVDERSLRLIESEGFPVDAAFQDFSPEENATRNSWIVAEQFAA